MANVSGDFQQITIMPNETFDCVENATNDVYDSVFGHIWYVFLARDIIILPPTLLGNTLILLAVARFPGLCRATSGILIGNLALSDLLMGILVFPADIGVRLSDEFARHVTDCAIYHTLIYVGLSASVLNLFLLSIERFHAIMKPLHHHVVFTKKRVYCIIAVIWLFVAAYGCLSFVTWHQGIQEQYLACPMKALLEGTFFRTLSSIIVSTITLNTIFFVVISRVVLRKASVIVKQGIADQTNLNTTMRRDIRHTVMVLMVSGLFILFWGPFCVISVIPDHSNLLKDVHILLAHVGVMNSCSNWIVYGWRSRNFRRAFRLLLKCRHYTDRISSS